LAVRDAGALEPLFYYRIPENERLRERSEL
jgi:hypothetical protein